MTINEVYGIGLSGLSANKALAAIASQNIANANTPGYVRQTMVLATRFLGLPGVDVEGPRAVRNPFLARQLVDTFGRLGYHEGMQTALSRVESAVNDLDGTGFGTQLTEFQTALGALAANPNSTVERDAAIASAKQLTAAFNSTRQQLLDGSNATYDEAVSTADQVNTMADEIAALNDQIRSLVGADKSANELIGQRDELVSQLGKMVDVEAVAQKDGSVYVFVGAGRALVDESGASELKVGTPGPAPGYAVDVTLERDSGQSLALGAPVGGRLGGLVDAYQETMAAAVAEIDALGQTVTDAFNLAHGAGGGGDLFEFNGARMSVAANVANNPANLNADGAGLAGSGDGAAAMAELIDTGNPSLIDAWQELTRNVSEPILLAQTGVGLESATAQQLETLLLSETAVSVDEELVALSQANAAFQAASEVIKIAEQLSSTVLNLVG